MSLICMKMKLYRMNRAYALTCPVAMQINWNKRKCLHKKRVQLPQDWFGLTSARPPFYYSGTPIWLPGRHVKVRTFYNTCFSETFFAIARKHKREHTQAQ